MAKRLKILFTGANGYLGGYFINYFKNSDYEINIFSKDQFNLILEAYKKNKLNYKNSKLFLNKKFDVVIHAAALPYKECEKNPLKAKNINTFFTEVLSNYCLNNNCYFIFFSSVQVYGKILNGIYKEETDIIPDSVYSLTKANAEEYLIKKFSENLLKGCILRIGNIVGLPQNENSSGWDLFSNSCIKEAFFKKHILIKNNPNLRRNFLSIDLLMVLLKKILNDFAYAKVDIPKIINVTSGNSKTLFEYSKIVSENYNNLFDQNIEIIQNESLISNVPYSVIDNKKLLSYLASSREYSINEPIKKILKFLDSSHI